MQSSKTNNLKDIIASIPTNTSLKSLYGYAEDYAKNWAPDGVLDHINFYIDLNDGVISKRAQIFLKSALRSEQLTTYFPAMSDGIEELADSTTNDISMSGAPIYEYVKWREHLKNAIESSSSDIAKASEVGIQIACNSKLDFRFEFKLDNRKWTKHFPFEKSTNS